jgi:polar amino acid transport system substrate-binding protein
MLAAGRLISVITIALSLPWSACLAETPSNRDLLVVTEDWAPYNFLTSNGEVSGLNTAIVRATLKTAGMEGEFHVYPWARTYFLAQNRPNTLIYSMSRSKARESQFVWIGELMRRDDRFYRAVGRRSVAPVSIDDIKAHYPVCVVNKDIVEDDLRRQGFMLNKNYMTTGSFLDCMKMVQTGAVPLLVNSPMNLAWELKKHARDVHTTFEPVLPLDSASQEPLYLAASMGTPPTVVKRLRAAFQNLQQTGQIEQIRRQFMEQTRSASGTSPTE